MGGREAARWSSHASRHVKTALLMIRGFLCSGAWVHGAHPRARAVIMLSDLVFILVHANADYIMKILVFFTIICY